jgi:hypothetical protein
VKDDVRDHALGETLDREVHALQPSGDRLGEIRRRGARRRTARWTAIGTALTVFVGGLGFAATQWRDRSRDLPAATTSLDPSPSSIISGHPRLGARCVFPRRLAADPSLQRRSIAVGDVNGDANGDAAWTVDVPKRPDRCSRFVVVVRTGVADHPKQALVARLPEWWAPQMPRVARLVHIDSYPGDEVVVTFDAGGFSRQVAIFSVRDGRLVPLRIFEMLLVADATRESDNLDCAGPGEIVWGTTGSRRGPSTDVLRRFYQLHGTRFQLEFRKTERLHVPSAWIGTRKMRAAAPELADLTTIFPSCSPSPTR